MSLRPSTTGRPVGSTSRLGPIAEAVAVIAALGLASTLTVGAGVLLSIYF